MAVNRYFNQYPAQDRIDNEFLLVEDLIVECIEMMGHNVYFIPRESLDDIDMIFGESTKVKFGRAYLIEAYLANINGFDGDKDFFSKFGLEIRDNSNLIISRRSFRKIVPSTLRSRPQEGDLLYVPVYRRMFEIKFIEEELGHFTLGKRLPYVYEMRCEQFRYSQEEIDTGVQEIDEVEEENAYTIKLNLQTTGSGSFKDDEIVYQSADGTYANNSAAARIKEWYKANGTMYVYQVEGQFSANANVYGYSSNSVYRATSFDDRGDFVMRDLYNNEDFDNSVELILDLSELNPFGTP